MTKKKLSLGKQLIKTLEQELYPDNIRSLDIEVVTKIYKQNVHLKDGVFGSYYTYDNGTNIPMYTTDIYWAYSLMNYLINKKYNFTLTNNKKGWLVTVSKNDDVRSVEDECLPLAITKASLKIINNENKNSS